MRFGSRPAALRPTLWPIMTPDPDSVAFADSVQKLAQTGEFNPFELLAGETAFHSLFLAPLSPGLAAAIQQFQADGNGPLAAVVAQFVAQGLEQGEAAKRASEIFQAARGMLVVVLASDHGPLAIPQFFFGALDDGFRQQAVATLGPQFAWKEPVAEALVALTATAQHGASGPTLIAGPGLTVAQGNVRDYWLDLGERLVAASERGFAVAVGGQDGRAADFAFWIGSAIENVPSLPEQIPLNEDEIRLAARCHLLAGHGPRAAALLNHLLHEDADPDALAESAVHLTEAACAVGQGAPVGEWLAGFIPRFEEMFGTCYELRLAAFKALTSSLAPVDAVVAAAKTLIAANRKSAKLDLTREPLWRVLVPVVESDLLDTAAAAQLAGLEPYIVAKRLDAGTFPCVRDGERVRVPRAALETWQAVMALL
jgi:hypothetical protein